VPSRDETNGYRQAAQLSQEIRAPSVSEERAALCGEQNLSEIRREKHWPTSRSDENHRKTPEHEDAKGAKSAKKSV
jgi:hypothetical protein